MKFYKAEQKIVGISHGDIGSYLGKKWFFPDYYIDTIKFHNSIRSDEVSNYEMLMIVYAANIIVNVCYNTNNRKINMIVIDKNVREKLDKVFKTIPDWFEKTIVEINDAVNFFIK